MSMRGVLRLGEVQLRVLNMAEAKEHYGARMGLHETMTDDNGLVYYKAWDEKDHHSVVLRESDRAGLDHFAFKVYDDATLDTLQEKLVNYGIAVENIASEVFPKSGRRLKFKIPSGHEMHLYAEKEQVGNTMGKLNPGAIPDEGVIRGFRIYGLDHCLLFGPNIVESVKLFTEVFDFDLTERVVDKNDQPFLLFIACTNTSHDIAFGFNPKPALLHHVSFRLNSTHDHIHAADLIGKYNITMETNDRHAVTQVKTVYYFDPSGNRNEVFCEGYSYYPDSPVLTWTMDNFSAAGFSQSRHMPETFPIVLT